MRQIFPASAHIPPFQGMLVHGYVIAAKKFGCIVGFYNGVKGLVPISEVSTEFVDTAEGLYKQGQVHI